MHLAGLPLELLGRIISHPAVRDSPASRAALFRSCHALARAVFLHLNGGRPALTCSIPHSPDGAYQWSATLDTLIGSKWQPLPLTGGLQLCVSGSYDKVSALPRTPPPRSISQLVTHLWLDVVALSEAALAGWQLHDAGRWPRLDTLGLLSCRSDVKGHARQRAASPDGVVVPPIPNLRRVVVRRAQVRAASARHVDCGASWSFSRPSPSPIVAQGTAKPHRWIWDVVLALASEAREVEFEGLTDVRKVSGVRNRLRCAPHQSAPHQPCAPLTCVARLCATAVAQVQALHHLPHLTHFSDSNCDGERQEDSLARALLDHPTLQHVTLDDWRWPLSCNLAQRPCRWRTLMVGRCAAHWRHPIAIPLLGLDMLTVRALGTACVFVFPSQELTHGVRASAVWGVRMRLARTPLRCEAPDAPRQPGARVPNLARKRRRTHASRAHAKGKTARPHPPCLACAQIIASWLTLWVHNCVAPLLDEGRLLLLPPLSQNRDARRWLLGPDERLFVVHDSEHRWAPCGAMRTVVEAGRGFSCVRVPAPRLLLRLDGTCPAPDVCVDWPVQGSEEFSKVRS